MYKMKEELLTTLPLKTSEFTQLYLDYNTYPFIDSSDKKRIITNNGVVQINDTQLGKCASFTGNVTTANVLRTPLDSSLELGTSDFTMETYAYQNDITTTDRRCINFGQLDNNGWYSSFVPYLNTWIFTYSNNNDGAVYISNNIIVPNAKTWNHVAVERYNGEIYLFLNGIKNTPVNNFPSNLSIDIKQLTIGGFYRANPNRYSHGFNGYLKNTIITIGQAKYINNFIPN